MRSTEWTVLVMLSSLLLGACSGTAPRVDEPFAVTPGQRPPSQQAAAGKPPQTAAVTTPDPATLTAYQNALQAMRSGDKAQAKARLQGLIEKQPGLAGPYINLGILLQGENDLDGAEAAFRSALQQNPHNAIAYNQLGLLLRQQGRFPEARHAYEAALQSDPDYPLAHRNIGILYDLYLRQPGKALEHYQRCQDLMEQPNREIRLWIADLQQRVRKEKP